MDEEGNVRSRHGEHELVYARVLQNAPPSLQARGVAPGTRFCLEGMTPGGPFAFELPDPGVVWIARTARRERRARPSVVGVQLRPGERRVAVLLRADVVYPLVRGERREATLTMAGPPPVAEAGGGA
jgi:hypothetical protein